MLANDIPNLSKPVLRALTRLDKKLPDGYHLHTFEKSAATDIPIFSGFKAEVLQKPIPSTWKNGFGLFKFNQKPIASSDIGVKKDFKFPTTKQLLGIAKEAVREAKKVLKQQQESY